MSEEPSDLITCHFPEAELCASSDPEPASLTPELARFLSIAVNYS